MSSSVARGLRLWLGASALLAGAAMLGIEGVELWAARQENAQVSLLADGCRLIARGNLDAAQVLADRMAANAAPAPRAELLYALGNARLRIGLVLLKTQPYRKAAPILRQARSAYREALALDPGNWDARYNYALVAPLLRDAEVAQPTIGEEMAHERAAWPDIPGAPNGMP